MLQEESVPHGTRLIDLDVFRQNIQQCHFCHSGNVRNHAFEDLEYLDGRHKILQSFRGKLYNPERNDGAIKKSIAEKIARSGLAYEDLKNVYSRYGKEGVIAILSRPPSCATTSPRVTRTGRILAAIVAHFQCVSHP